MLRVTRLLSMTIQVAPEVLRKDYDKSADIWSAGKLFC